jgi:hypothetical protein
MKSERKQKVLAAKRTAKARRFAATGNKRGKSAYARKAAYLKKVGKWGFEIPMAEKFWRKAG